MKKKVSLSSRHLLSAPILILLLPLLVTRVALANAGFAAKGKRASREEMAKVNAAPNQYEKKLQERRYGSPGSKSAAVEDALRASFAVENKQDDPSLWNVEKAVDAIGNSL